MRRIIPLILAIVLLVAFIPEAYACSTFCLTRSGGVVYGRNYDFEIGDALVLVNKRGMQKKSWWGTRTWTSRYGSVTFNQFGREEPMDGMNEAGLVVSLMWLDPTVYPPADNRPALRVLEWIQYQLDNYATVAEVLAHADEVRIKGGAPLHYLIADATGAAATIEYLNGVLVTRSGASLPTANLTNSSYDESLRYLRGFSGFGGSRSMPSGFGSLERFARTAMLMKNADGRRPLTDVAFDILANVAQPGWTRWSVVYDPRGVVSWVTLRSGTRKTLRLSDVDFSCNTPMKMIDANTTAGGDILPSLVDYSPATNLDLVVRSYAGTSFLREVSRGDIESNVRHAESPRCQVATRRRSIR